MGRQNPRQKTKAPASGRGPHRGTFTLYSGTVSPLYSRKVLTSLLEPFPSSPSKPRQQRVVVLRPRDPLDQPFHPRLWRHLAQPSAQRVHRVQLVGAEEFLFSPRPARRDVDRRIDPLLRQRPIELDL